MILCVIWSITFWIAEMYFCVWYSSHWVISSTVETCKNHFTWNGWLSWRSG